MDCMSSDDNVEQGIFDVPDEHIVQSSRGKNWGGLDVAEIVHPLDDFALPAIPRHVLVVNLGSPSVVREQGMGRQGHLGLGGLVILPAGAPTNWHLEREGQVRHLHLYLSPRLIAHVASQADLNPDHVELIEAIGVPDPQIERIALSYLCELRSGGLGGKIYVESLANLLVIHLLRQHSSLKQPTITQPVGLERHALRRVLSYIEDHLGEDLTLATIAAIANLSPYHFARRFKEATGHTPHHYVIQRRVERATLLLTSTQWSPTSIAHQVGFASESHLALHCKRLTGLTPKQYRS